MKQDIYANNVMNHNVDVMVLANQIATRVNRGREFYDFAKEHMKWIIEEMDEMQGVDFIVANDGHDELEGRSSKRRSITRSSCKTFKPTTELTILPPLIAKTKESGKGGRPKGGGVPRLKSDRELRTKGRQCKSCGKKMLIMIIETVHPSIRIQMKMIVGTFGINISSY